MKLFVSSLPTIPTAAVAVYLLCVSTSPAPIYMKYEGIDGDVTAPQHQSWIEVQSMDWGVRRDITNNPATANREASSPSVSDISVSKSIDRASPSLNFYGVAGTITNVAFDLTESNATETTYYKIELKDVMVSSIQTSGNSSNTPMEQVSLNFSKIEWTYTHGPSVYEKWQGSYDLETGAAFEIHVTATDNDGDGVENVDDPDDDNDGMPDDYETANGLNPFVDDSRGNADGDGASNLEEFLAGTQAGLALSVFRVSMLQVGSADGMLTWSSVSNRQYRVGFSPDVKGPYNDMGQLFPSTGEQTTIPVPVNAAQRFYKVTVVPPAP